MRTKFALEKRKKVSAIMVNECKNCERGAHRACSNPQDIMTSQSLTNVILGRVPKESEVTRVEYEWPRIALYTRNPKFLQQNSYIVSDVVNIVKVRVVVRTEKAFHEDQREAKAVDNKTDSNSSETRRLKCCCGKDSWAS